MPDGMHFHFFGGTMRIEKISAVTLKVASMRNSVRFYGAGPQACESWQVATVGLQTQRSGATRHICMRLATVTMAAAKLGNSFPNP